MKFFLLILKNVRRNLLRSTLTALGTMVLVCVVILVWSILAYLDELTQDKTSDFKMIVTERWRLPSRMPFGYAPELCAGAPRKPGDYRVPPEHSATWQFFVGTLNADLKKQTRESILFVIATEPRKVLTMFDELDDLPAAQAHALAQAVDRLESTRNGIVVGMDRLAAIDKRIGERFTAYGLGDYKGIDLEFEVVGTFPNGRYNNTAVINREYLNDALDAYGRVPGHAKHPLADRSLNLVWLKVPDKSTYTQVAGQITSSPSFRNPPVRCETASSGMSGFLAAFGDLLWGMRWILSPAILVTLSLVIANAISISVRERRTELAVLKVLGFRPGHLLLLVLGEAVLIGAMAGLASALLTYGVINWGFGGLKFPIAFFRSFEIPLAAIWWGAAIGALTALAGSFIPAWNARGVKVAEVFSKVA
jgi:putative ABC transport system permease protein